MKIRYFADTSVIANGQGSGGHARCGPLGTYPFLVFYMPQEDHVDVWGVLHGERDLPVWMREDPRGG